MTRRTLLLPLLLTALCLLAGASVARAQDGDHRAGLIIRYADGSVQKRCVAFSEPTITGAELLARSGLQVTMDRQRHGWGSVQYCWERLRLPHPGLFLPLPGSDL